MTPKQKAVAGGVVAAIVVGGLVLKNALTIVPVPFRMIEMQYPAGINMNDYTASLESSTNLTDWTDRFYLVEQLPLATNWHVWPSNNVEFFRVKLTKL